MGSELSKIENVHNDFELAIRVSKELEYLLENSFGAKGKGLHEKISSARHKGKPLNPDLVRKMRYCATLRNKLIHDRTYNKIDDKAAFISKFRESEKILKDMLPKTNSGNSKCLVM